MRDLHKYDWIVPDPSLDRGEIRATWAAILAIIFVLVLIFGIARIFAPGVQPPPAKPRPQRIHFRQCPIDEDACWTLVAKGRFE